MYWSLASWLQWVHARQTAWSVVPHDSPSRASFDGEALIWVSWGRARVKMTRAGWRKGQCSLPRSQWRERWVLFVFNHENTFWEEVCFSPYFSFKFLCKSFNSDSLPRQFVKLYPGFEFGKSSFTEARRRAKAGAGEGGGLDLVATGSGKSLQRAREWKGWTTWNEMKTNSDKWF